MRRSHAGGGFALFAETLLAGVMVTVSSLAVVTFLPALAAGSAHLRRHLDGRMDTVGAFGRDLVAAWRALWAVAVGFTVATALLILDIVWLARGQVPGGWLLTAAVVVLATAAAVSCLRAAAIWCPGGATGRPLVRVAARRSWDDLAGSAIIVVAVSACAVLVWMLLPLLLVAPGLLVLALVAVERRV